MWHSDITAKPILSNKVAPPLNCDFLIPLSLAGRPRNWPSPGSHFIQPAVTPAGTLIAWSPEISFLVLETRSLLSQELSQDLLIKISICSGQDDWCWIPVMFSGPQFSRTGLGRLCPQVLTDMTRSVSAPTSASQSSELISSLQSNKTNLRTFSPASVSPPR